MSSRPIFVAGSSHGPLVLVQSFDFHWHSGFAPSQKRKNVLALHREAAAVGISPVLEVSTKSEDPLGRGLSAFNLLVSISNERSVPLEVAYQSSKRFQQGGPFHDLVSLEPRDAKRDPRLRESGHLISFEFAGRTYPIDPPTAFYDWLYMRALQRVPQLLERLHAFAGFSDIEFNPLKSLNCQARSCAVAVALVRRGSLTGAARSFEEFLREMVAASPVASRSAIPWQMELSL